MEMEGLSSQKKCYWRNYFTYRNNTLRRTGVVLLRPFQKKHLRCLERVNWKVPRHSSLKAIVLLRCHGSLECHITDHSVF